MVGRGTDPRHVAKVRFFCHYVSSALPSSVGKRLSIELSDCYHLKRY